jgi:hypothetical protein
MWAFATRNRIKNCERFIQAWLATKASTAVYVRLDLDDPSLEQLQRLSWPDTFEIHVGQRVRVGEAMQEMFGKYPDEPWYGILADDVIPQTPHWDQRLVQAAGSNRISCANEVHEKAIRICHPCVGGDLVRLVGCFAIPTVKHFGSDTLWESIHHCCGLNNKLHDVVLEHAHFNFGQSELDQTYEESQALRRQDKLAYKAWMNENFESIIEKLNQSYGWNKVRERSGWV